MLICRRSGYEDEWVCISACRRQCQFGISPCRYDMSRFRNIRPKQIRHERGDTKSSTAPYIIACLLLKEHLQRCMIGLDLEPCPCMFSACRRQKAQNESMLHTSLRTNDEWPFPDHNGICSNFEDAEIKQVKIPYACFIALKISDGCSNPAYERHNQKKPPGCTARWPVSVYGVQSGSGVLTVAMLPSSCLGWIQRQILLAAEFISDPNRVTDANFDQEKQELLLCKTIQIQQQKFIRMIMPGTMKLTDWSGLLMASTLRSEPGHSVL